MLVWGREGAGERKVEGEQRAEAAEREQRVEGEQKGRRGWRGAERGQRRSR